MNPKKMPSAEIEKVGVALSNLVNKNMWEAAKTLVTIAGIDLKKVENREKLKDDLRLDYSNDLIPYPGELATGFLNALVDMLVIYVEAVRREK